VAISNVRFNIPKHLTVNLAVPSDKGPFGPGPSASDSGATFEVDYIRVWSQNKISFNGSEKTNSFGSSMNPQTAVSTESLIKKKNKSFYGNYKNEAADGPKITLFQQHKQVQLTVLGNVKANLPLLQISSVSGNFSYQQLLDKQFTALSLETFKSGSYVLKVSWNGISASHPIVIE